MKYETRIPTVLIEAATRGNVHAGNHPTLCLADTFIPFVNVCHVYRSESIRLYFSLIVFIHLTQAFPYVDYPEISRRDTKNAFN